ncbi:MAG: KpsF/GutQ family sugar-phosphate isomerase [Defluviitaleaceae bacterium]|nr:KpsF/GutQ family sugar-phosphate isomerase [Defluviitaleaceae bacterium]
MDILKEAREVFLTQRQSLDKAMQYLGDEFVQLVEDIRGCTGRVIIVGVGKSSHVASKTAATMTSLGTPAFFLHPAESLHGDLGRICQDDIVIFYSKSGESEEINQMLPSIRVIGAKTVAVTCRDCSVLSRGCDHHIRLSITEEASTYHIAPTSSTTVMMVFGDALAVCLEKLSDFTPDDFAVFHPSGSLGKRLLFTVADVMVTEDDMPFVYEGATIKETIIEMTSKAVIGGVAIVNESQKLLGIFTDGDLRRLVGKMKEMSVIEKRIIEVMSPNPITLFPSTKAIDALTLMQNPDKTIGIVPIIDNDSKLVGMLSVNDLIKMGL